MATALPHQPNLEQLRKQARDLQRAVRSGQRRALRTAGLAEPAPDYSLNRAQLALARKYGFASWPRLREHVNAIAARSWTHEDAPAHESQADRFLRLACLNYAVDTPNRWADAAALLSRHSELPSAGVAVAAVCADVSEVRRQLAADPRSASAPTGPYGWSPLMYVTYARLDVDLAALLATVRLLLDAGADPNDGRFFLGLPTPFTVLTGVFGGGENDPPPHPHSGALARTLLAAGADPNDGQALYNRMFGTADDFLEVLFEFGLGRGDGGPWRRLLPDLLPDPATLVRTLLSWAVTHDQRNRVALLARNGVDVTSPLPAGATPIELAMRNGHRELVAQLRALGADTAALDPVDQFIADALTGDVAAVLAAPAAVVATAKQTRPALIVWAAGLDRVAAAELLVAAGFDVNAFGRSDVVDATQKWHTALHAAVEHGNEALVRKLLELGADRDLRDQRFDATPAEWAVHLNRPDLAALLTE